MLEGAGASVHTVLAEDALRTVQARRLEGIGASVHTVCRERLPDDLLEPLSEATVCSGCPRHLGWGL